MKTKQHITGIALIIVLLIAISFIGVSVKSRIAGTSSSLDLKNNQAIEVQNNNIMEEVGFVDEVDFAMYDTKTYSFKYPREWIVKKDSDSYIRIENFDPKILKDSEINRSISNYLKIEIIKLDGSGYLTLGEWLDNFAKTSYPTPEIIDRQNIKISGLPAVYLLEKYGSRKSPAVYLKKEDSVFIINISENYDNFSSSIDMFLDSFDLK